MRKINKYHYSSVILLLLAGYIQCHEYDIKIWGIPVGMAELQDTTGSEVSLKIRSNELIDYIMPVNLEFYSKFRPTDHTMLENKKTTMSGSNEQNYTAVLENGNILVYNEQDSIALQENTCSLLSFLSKTMHSTVDELDTKWFDLENEGSLYKTRLLWNDTTTVSLTREDVLCDHYRLDLEIIDDSKNIFDETDYFNELFFDINSVRQIWIEKWQNQQRIIKITLSNNLINLSLTIRD